MPVVGETHPFVSVGAQPEQAFRSEISPDNTWQTISKEKAESETLKGGIKMCLVCYRGGTWCSVLIAAAVCTNISPSSYTSYTRWHNYIKEKAESKL